VVVLTPPEEPAQHPAELAIEVPIESTSEPTAASRLAVLVHAAEEVQQQTNTRSLAANALCAVLPLAVGVILVAPFGSPTIGVGFVVAVCLVSIFKLGLWMELSRGVAYRATVLDPQIVRLAGLECGVGRGYLERLAQERRLYRRALLHGAVAAASLAIGAWVALRDAGSGFELRAIVVALASLATAAAYAVALPQVRKNLDASSASSASRQPLT
jgi:hypothetical protein